MGPGTGGMVAADWPNIASSATLADGTEIIIRALTPEYREKYMDAVQHLTPDFLLERFLSPPTISESFFHTFVDEVDGIDHIAIIAGTAKSEVSVGAARMIRYPHRADAADIAVAVLPEWQRRGAAKALIAELMRHRLVGVTTLVTLVEAHNAAAIRLLQEIGETEVGPVRGGVREVTVVLPQKPA